MRCGPSKRRCSGARDDEDHVMSQKSFLTAVGNVLETKDPRSSSFEFRVLSFESKPETRDAKLETIFEVNL